MVPHAEDSDVEDSDSDRHDGGLGRLVMSTLLFPLHATDAMLRFGLRSLGLLPRNDRS